MPHKYNADRRHRIPKRRYKVTNWQAYEAGLRQRGSLTIWFSEEAIAAWRAAPRTTPGGQARYSDLAIETSLILRTVFHQPLRQTEGLVGSLLELMGLDLPVPDHTHLEPAGQDAGGGSSGPDGERTGAPAGRQHRGEAQRAGRMAGREAWHPAPSRLAQAAPGRRCEDRHDRRLDPDQQGGRRCRRTRPACSTRSTSRSPPSSRTAPTTRTGFTMLWPSILRKPRLSCRHGRRPCSAPSAETDPTQRDRHIQAIAEQGRMGWQKTSGYNARAGAEIAAP